MVTIKRIIIENPPEEDAERFNRGLRAGMKDAVKLWQREIAKKHFRDGADTKYGYAPRQREYLQRKFSTWGHRRPLVFTGNTEKWVRYRMAEPRVWKVGDGGLSCRLPVKVPKYFFMRRGNAPDKYAELIATVPDEYEVLFKRVDEAIDRELERGSSTRKVINF